MRGIVPNHLKWPEIDALVEFFLYRMGPEQRGELKTSYPIIYAKLFPSVDAENILNSVRQGIEQAKREALNDY